LKEVGRVTYILLCKGHCDISGGEHDSSNITTCTPLLPLPTGCWDKRSIIIAS
jgi:hypothetical protein